MWPFNRSLLITALLVSLFAICQSQTHEANATTKHDNPTTTPNTTPIPAVHNITTQEPNTTTTEPSTTPQPGPAKRGAPPVLNYEITESLGKNETIICLMASFAVQFEITYNNTENKTENAYLSINNGSVVKDESKCGENTTILVIEINDDKNDKLTMDIVRDNGNYYVNHIVLSLDGKTIKDIMPDAPKLGEIIATVNNKSMFEAPESKSYKCNAETTQAMDSMNKVNVKMIVKDVQFDAFRGKDAGKETFRTAKRCPADEEINDVIPIAVGAALGALVVIVLIAYFIGRRRSRRLAYQSV